ncbi:hypothetical protein ACE6H2_018710 [Prunus campanulata]
MQKRETALQKTESALQKTETAMQKMETAIVFVSVLVLSEGNIVGMVLCRYF